MALAIRPLRWCLTSLLFFLSISLIAKENKVVLITSIETPPDYGYVCWARICFPTPPSLPRDLEAIFRHQLANEAYELAIFHQLNQYQLFKLLTTERYDAIFFVSHSLATDSQTNTGIITFDRILDKNKVDIKPILKLVNANFFAFCGCYSNTHLQAIIEGYPTNHSSDVFGFSEAIDAKTALKKAIKKFIDSKKLNQKKLGVVYQASNTDDQIILINAKRTAPAYTGLPAIQISLNGKLRAMLPGASPGETQELQFQVSSSLNLDDFDEHTGYLTIEVSNGYHSMDFSKPTPGSLAFSSPNLQGNWQVYRKASDGEVMGHNTNFYLYFAEDKR